MDRVKQTMKDKVPEIERSLDLVRHLQERQVIPNRTVSITIPASVPVNPFGRTNPHLPADCPRILCRDVFLSTNTMLQRRPVSCVDKQCFTQFLWGFVYVVQYKYHTSRHHTLQELIRPDDELSLPSVKHVTYIHFTR